MSRLLCKQPKLSHQFILGDCLDVLKGMPDNSVDLIITSPPYEDARLYGELNFKVKGQDWVDWAIPRFEECYRVCKGLVAWVVEGKTRNFQWSATPALLMADLHRAGVKLRKPPVFYRAGIPGSGGPDWVRNDYEFVVCASNGRLPWSDNTAMGHPPKYDGIGGMLSHRTRVGDRCLEKGRSGRRVGKNVIRKDGSIYTLEKANPGNVIHCIVGGGNIGHRLAHENEAPFPEKLAEFFIRSFCPPNGIVLDPFVGSGTSVCVAKRLGRNGIGIEIRQEMIDICNKRILDPIYESTYDI